MLAYSVIALFVGSYILGSISFSQIVSKIKGIDLFKEGSGNLGATNVFRVLGWKYGIVVFLLDAVKGAIPVATSLIVIPEEPAVHVLCGLIVVLGHSYSIFAKLKGGKGAATGVGVIAVLAPKALCVILPIAALVILTTRIVSIGTISCSLLLPPLMWYFNYSKVYIICMSCMCLLILWRHKENIKRLIKRTENKF